MLVVVSDAADVEFVVVAVVGKKGAEQHTQEVAPTWNFGGEYALAKRRASRSVGNENDAHLRLLFEESLLRLSTPVVSSARAMVATQETVATL